MGERAEKFAAIVSLKDRFLQTRGMWFLYLLECANGSVYTGIALDVEARFQQHLAGRGAKYTRAYPPKKILGTKGFRTRGAAQKEEWRVKQLSADEKRAFARTLKTVKVLALFLLPVTGLAASPPEECVIRVAPGFPVEYALLLNSKAFKVITDPEITTDDFQGLRDRYVKKGEYALLFGGWVRGGFSLWRKHGDQPVLSHWRWFTSTQKVLQEELPVCSDFLNKYKSL